MNSKLDAYIDKYIRDAGETDKKVARHLKEIIPKTTHLDEKTFNEIIEVLKAEMDKGKDFKDAFHEVREKYILKGDIIKAQLPDLLTRIIVNIRIFLDYLTSRLGVEVEDIEKRIDADDMNRFIRSIGFLKLAPPNSNVVFATFDEEDPESDPFANCKVEDIINMIGKDRSNFDKGEPLSAIKVRYRNQSDIEKRFPIFIDAGWYDKFYPSEKDDKYGRTRSLEPVLKNMPEITHKNVTFAEVTEDIELLEE